MWNTILVPYDFSESAEHAIEIAVHEARIHRACVVLLNVVELQADFGRETLMMVRPGTTDQVSVLRYHLEVAEAELRATVARIEHDGVEIRVVVRSGVPVEEIREYLSVEPVDLIVMGTHGRSGLRRMLAGSVAERLVRASSVPVMTICHPDAAS